LVSYNKEGARLRVFEDRVLKMVFGLKREKVAGGWRRLHNEELHNLHTSPNIIQLVKSRRMRGASHVDEKYLQNCVRES
jgi:hypothetical protein